MHMVLGGQAFLSDCHFVPQASFVWGPQGKQWCQNILRIDTLPTSAGKGTLTPARMWRFESSCRSKECGQMHTSKD